jgi:hypothetical protein
MAVVSTTAPVTARREGRGYFLAGIGVCLLGPVLYVLQYSLKQLIVPWYVPGLTTAGVLLLLGCVARRVSVPRVIVLGLLAATAAFEWYVLAVPMALPAYAGPARPGQKIPTFRSTLANGGAFTDKDLQKGRPSVLVFFRGRW